MIQVLLSSGKGRLKVYSPKKQPAIFKKPAAPSERIAQPEQKEGRIVVYDKENVPTDHDGKGDGVKKVAKPQPGRVGRPPKEVSCNYFNKVIEKHGNGSPPPCGDVAREIAWLATICRT